MSSIKTILLLLALALLLVAPVSAYLPQTTNNPNKGSKIPLIIEGTVGQITDTESIWVALDDTTFRQWAVKLSQGNVNAKNQEIRIYLKYASPEKSAAFAAVYQNWLKQKILYELTTLFQRKAVTVHYEYFENSQRLEGTLQVGSKDISLWMISNGYSFYLINQGLAPDHSLYVAAEKQAESQQLGLWKILEKTQSH